MRSVFLPPGEAWPANNNNPNNPNQALARDVSDPATGHEHLRVCGEKLQRLHMLLTTYAGAGGLQRTLTTAEEAHVAKGTRLAGACSDAVGGWSERDSPLVERPDTWADCATAPGVVTWPEDIPRENIIAGGLRHCVSIPGAVSFAAKACALPVPFASPDHVALGLAARMAASCFLHREIREQGGAYGSGCGVSGGRLVLHSYRDPQPLASVATFQRARAWLLGVADSSPTLRDLEEAKLSLFGDLDVPTSPESKGVAEWQGVRPELQDSRREAAFELSLEQVKQAVEKHLDESLLQSADACVAASELHLPALREAGWEIIEAGSGSV
jgi:hypothetical protein